MSSLDKEELAKLTELLNRLEPGFLPFGVFHEVSRLVVTPIIEVVPLRKSGEAVEVLLLEREPDDPVWPGQLHTPGTGVRVTDEPGSFHSAFQRIFADELRGVEISEPIFVKNILHHSGRGMEASQIYWVEIKGEPIVGKFYNVESLPGALVESQKDFIPLAIENFKDRQP